MDEIAVCAPAALYGGAAIQVELRKLGEANTTMRGG